MRNLIAALSIAMSCTAIVISVANAVRVATATACPEIVEARR
jgi:hypothetical protein